VTLEQILANAPEAASLPAELRPIKVRGLDYDSRRIQPGWVFFAFRGERTDGAAFAADARRRGAVAVVSESPAPSGFVGPWIQVGFARQTLAAFARAFYPSAANVLLTGITGTNGKTTTSYLVDSIFRAASKTTALIGTIEYHVAGERRPAVNTTPESLDLYRLLAELAERGGTHATMEVSSHALEIGRVRTLEFHTAAFTNLTQDHLDFHQTMPAYFAAKSKLFEGQDAPPPKYAVINFDDDWGRRIRVARETTAWWYGMTPGATLRATKVSSTFSGLSCDIAHDGGTLRIASPLVGQINVYNILAACAVGLTYGLEAAVIEAGIAQCTAVPGRFERIDEGQPFLVVVDYAHSPDALRNVIAAARTLDPQRVITLFGCGGDRDRSKRPMMGAAAAQFSDYVVLTSDNPRSEDPLSILNDALVGLRRFDTPHEIEPDRETAIASALRRAKPGDIVILAGKGHETYQVLADKTIDFDDREVARRVLREMRS
jgi:UDP-N-acetylmuramoyl-L-alanyl-D-glutamate--2,6-diaminopimelate ligase